jgi:hypothetical protein
MEYLVHVIADLTDSELEDMVLTKEQIGTQFLNDLDWAEVPALDMFLDTEMCEFGEEDDEDEDEDEDEDDEDY